MKIHVQRDRKSTGVRWGPAYYKPFRNSGVREEWIVRVYPRCGLRETVVSIDAVMKNRVYDNKRGLRRSHHNLSIHNETETMQNRCT